MAGGIFINYRRDDAGSTAGRLRDRLAQVFGPDKLFMDVDNIPAGADFADYLNAQVATCDVFLAVLGPNWVSAKDETGRRRIDNPDDFVTIEIQAALARGIRVIPVTVDGASLPKAGELPNCLKPLVRRQAVEVRNHQFGRDVDALIEDVRATFRGHVRQSGRLVAAVAVLLLLAGGSALYYFAKAPTWGLWRPKPESQRALEPMTVVSVPHTSEVAASYTRYISSGLGLTVTYPNNILTLNTTAEKERRLTLLDVNGHALVTITKTNLPDHKDVRKGRQQEYSELTKSNYSVTYEAPENDMNWGNWYVLSGIGFGTEFYFRRWYLDDSVVSMEFRYPKELTPLFDNIIDNMTHKLEFSAQPGLQP